MSKRIFTFIIIISLLLYTPIIYCATEEGYGEANDNLGQFVDSYENDNNVSVVYQVINNVTLECMELNITASARVFEKFTEYTEADALNRLTQSDYFSNFTILNRLDDNILLYYDMGANNIGDFQGELDLFIDDVDNSAVQTARCAIFGATTINTDLIGIRDGGGNQVTITCSSSGVAGTYIIPILCAIINCKKNMNSSIPMNI